jgi:hypothetical protein
VRSACKPLDSSTNCPGKDQRDTDSHCHQQPERAMLLELYQLQVL